MLLKVGLMKNLVYVWYEKIQKVGGTFGISVSEEELKKRIKEDVADGS